MTPRATSLFAFVLAMGPALVAAQSTTGAPDGGPPAFSIRTSFKTSGLFSRTPDAPLLFPSRNNAASLWRLRLEPTLRPKKSVIAGAAYEQRLRAFSADVALAGLGVLPADTAAPFRIRQLDWQISQQEHTAWRHEIDRAYLEITSRRATVTLGRQAIGWGRGVLFGAVDLFSPFSPLEADREWRRGVDAIRGDVKLADRVSLDMVGAFGESLDTSVFAGRLRGYAGRSDLELVAGRRARDIFCGITHSAAVGDAEIHAEFAVFRLPAPLVRDLTGEGARVLIKAVAGTSYRFPLGNGVLAWAEYHYSGFGARRPGDILTLVADPAFRDRYLRGDTQILGRHALAVLASYEFSPEFTFSGQWLQSPTDRSGVVAPSTTVTFGDRFSLVGTVYAPFGQLPDGMVLRSEYGTAAASAFLQLRAYW